MDFTPDETQRAAGELAAEVFTGDGRGAGVGAGGPDPARGVDTWRALAETGLLGLALPERLGGDGLGAAEIAAVLREAGRAASTSPAWATLALGLLPMIATLDRGGSDGGRDDPDGRGGDGAPEDVDALLQAVAAGEALLTAALHEPSAPMTTRPATVAEPCGDGWRLVGVKTAVPLAAEAERILVPATLTGGSGPDRPAGDGTAVFLVDSQARGVRIVPTHTASGMPEASVRFDGVETGPPPGGTDAGCARGVRAVHRHALAGAAAFGDGLLAGALALTTDHLAARRQFGRPLATFQAVAQQAADVYIAARTVHLAAGSASWLLGRGLEADADLAVAAYWLAEEAPAALATCHHLHGGIGLDETYPLHRYSALLKDLIRGIGGADRSLDRVAATVGGA